jgi:hypothetical protein
MRIEKVFVNFLIIISCLLLLVSCATGHYFKTSNDVFKINGSLFMEDGTEKKGSITILLENGPSLKNDIVHFIPADSSKEQLIPITAIQYYAINGDNYYPKYLNLYTSGVYRLLFVKRLSPANSSIQLYELQQKFKSNNTGEEATYYFISLPKFTKYEAIELNSEQLVPNFDLKMSAFIIDCPALANKIKNGQKNYTYSILSFGSKKLDIIKKIIDEYNSCK